jgi:hypothetical protein
MLLLATAIMAMLAPRAGARLGDIMEIAVCDPLKNVFEDPIVSPGVRSAHLHTVFGATTFSDMVTSKDLAPDVESTCDLQMDKSMYWVPALMHEGAPLPAKLRVYLAHDTKGDLTPFPLGLRVKVQDARYLEWFCISDKGAGRREPQLPMAGFPGMTTPSGKPCIRWQARQQFPSCWDGLRLDSYTHRHHLAYSRDRVCPDTHPVALPELRFVVTFMLPDEIKGPLVLSDSTDHGGETIHFDFISGWDEAALGLVLSSKTTR